MRLRCRQIALLTLSFSLLSLPARAVDSGWIELPNSPLAAQGAGNSMRHDDLDFLDADHGWVVNGEGEVWKTNNGGTNWSLLHDTGVYNRCVSFADSLHGWIGTLYQLNGQALLSTTDGGHNWTPVALPDPVPHGICGLQAVDSTTVCAVGAYYGFPRFVRSIDGGQTWSVKDMSLYAGALVDTYWFNANLGIAVGSTAPGPTRKTVILRTTDGGDNWSVRWTGTRNNELCWKISFVDSQIGFVSIENLNGTGPSYFLKTVNGGFNWTEVLFESSYRNAQGIGFINELLGWIGGWGFNCERTRDGGQTWQAVGFGFNVNRFRFINPSLGYACGKKVYKYLGNSSDVGDAAPPARPHLLGQNRPNPFGSGTVIPYRVTEPGAVSLKLYDLQGRLLRTLADGSQGAGDYTATLDGAQLSAGAYFYQLTTPAGVETQKLWVVR